MIWLILTALSVIGLVFIGMWVLYLLSGRKFTDKLEWGFLIGFVALLIILPDFLPFPQRIFNLGAELAFFVLFCLPIVVRYLNKARSGPVLLDLGQGDYPSILVPFGIIMVGVISLSLYLDYRESHFVLGPSKGDVALLLMGFTFVLARLLFNRRLITERGIFFKVFLIKWENIRSFQWETQPQATLRLCLSRSFPLKEVCLVIPASRQEDVRAFLLEKAHSAVPSPGSAS